VGASDDCQQKLQGLIMSTIRFRCSINRWAHVPVLRRCAPSRKARARCIPRVVALEVRALLSTITVTNDGDDGSGSLRDALAAASSGDTIEFARSAYGTITLSGGPLVVASSVTIDGPGPGHLTISGNHSFQDIQVQANVTARISGLTITGGVGTSDYPYGGGIVNNGDLTVADCDITNNSVPQYGEGGGIDNNADLIVTNSVISGNGATFGGGVFSSGTLMINDSTITANSAAGGEGGGIYNLGTATITNSVVSNNMAASGGAIDDDSISAGGGALIIKGSVVSNNSSAGAGGGIVVYNSSVTIEGSTFANNRAGDAGAATALGGAICAEGSVTLAITASLFAANVAECSDVGSALGGAIYMSNFGGIPPGTLAVSSSDFVQNSADGFAAYGGAIEVDAGVDVAVTSSLFGGNSARGDDYAEGGALDLEISSAAHATISVSSFLCNQALVQSLSSSDGGNANGGAVFTDGPLTIKNSSFIGNEAIGGAATDGGVPGNGEGGAIDNVGTLTVNGDMILGNEAVGGSGGGNGYGGGIYSTGTTKLTGTLITLNLAAGGEADGQGCGGGLYIVNGVTIVTANTKVMLNQATTSSNNIYGSYSN
jgi:hypothetical protein